MLDRTLKDGQSQERYFREEVVNVVVIMCSPSATYLNGTSHFINAGMDGGKQLQSSCIIRCK